jgi:prevent-host-death family protein
MSETTLAIDIAELRSELDSLVERVSLGWTRVLVEKDGAAVAVIISPDDFARLERTERAREQGFEAMQEISRAFADVPAEELEERLAEALLEARAELRAERKLAEQKLAAAR